MNHMKKFVFGSVLGFGLASGLMAAGTNQPVAIDIADERARVSYALGMLTMQQWNSQRLDFNADAFVQGLRDQAAGRKTLLSPEEAQAAIMSFRSNFSARQEQMRVELAAKNKAAGETFLATNKNNPGVVTLPDGLQYHIGTKGSGKLPVEGSMVSVHYRGTLVDGTEFDSSIQRGQPFQFRVGVDRVIAGWTEVIQKMPSGSKWKVFIPAELAYGAQGRPGIPPNSVLIFEIEVLDVQAPPPPPAPVTSEIIKVQGTNTEVLKAEDAVKAPKKAH
jgi:FKBP-type peptidyl-prolyl cis-trans isomerase